MIVLRVNCLKVNTKEDFFQCVQNEFDKLVMTYLNATETIDCYSINNFDALWDKLDSFNFEENPCMCIISNFNHCKSFFDENEINILTSLFAKLENTYQDNFKCLVFNNDADLEIKTTQLEFVDIQKNF